MEPNCILAQNTLLEGSGDTCQPNLAATPPPHGLRLDKLLIISKLQVVPSASNLHSAPLGALGWAGRPTK